MTTIVMNTLTGAVSEYDWEFQSITPTHAGDASGLYLLGGDLDGEAEIDATVMTGKTLWGSSLKKKLDTVFFALTGEGQGQLLVDGADTYEYDFTISDSGESHVTPGKGINENYLAFGFANLDGADFRLDRMEVPIAPSTNRR